MRRGLNWISPAAVGESTVRVVDLPLLQREV